MAAVAWVAGAILSAGCVAAVVYYLRRAVLNSVALEQRDAALEVEQQRIAAEEKAKDAARAVRAREFENEKIAVVSAADAARLLQRAADDTQAD